MSRNLTPVPLAINTSAAALNLFSPTLMMSFLQSVFVGRIRALSFFCGSVMLLGACSVASAKVLRIGVTLHPYYSYVANIVGDKAQVVPLIPAGFNPHAYEPRAEDIKRINDMDVIVVNGIGHDDFADRMIQSSDNPKVPLIEANANVPLLAATGPQLAPVAEQHQEKS
ncbi:metal ABC transporter solute-binding protein, Zn/Mn family [Advenella kashmirensis]|uniref:metal ABC transporter solute-binding protein, Zn/Mn family n=1 Tax=Advenella kashmirensis TaxID=310575 RepID=UPI0021F8064D|nr:zinc ABC transporter substrate-binding protein [Advenella kashmirensis]